MLNLNALMIGTSQPKMLAEFYTKVFDRAPDMVEGEWYGWQVGNQFLSIGGHSEVHGQAQEPQRLIFNFETTTVQQEFDRIKSAGATVIKEPYDMQGALIATLADPDGNFFQLMRPWES